MLDILNDMYNVMLLLGVTFYALLFLDYLFGTDWLDDARHYVATNDVAIGTNIFICIVSLIRALAYFFGIKELVAFSTFMFSLLVGAIWACYGFTVCSELIADIRKHNILKRKKPR